MSVTTISGSSRWTFSISTRPSVTVAMRSISSSRMGFSALSNSSSRIRRFAIRWRSAASRVSHLREGGCPFRAELYADFHPGSGQKTNLERLLGSFFDNTCLSRPTERLSASPHQTKEVTGCYYLVILYSARLCRFWTIRSTQSLPLSYCCAARLLRASARSLHLGEIASQNPQPCSRIRVKHANILL
jgi:hypothetical protein